MWVAGKTVRTLVKAKKKRRVAHNKALSYANIWAYFISMGGKMEEVGRIK